MLHSKTVAGQRACGRHGSAGRVMVLSSQGQRLVKPFQVQLVVWDGFIPPRSQNPFLTMPQTCTIYNPLPGCSDRLLSKLWCLPCCAPIPPCHASQSHHSHFNSHQQLLLQHCCSKHDCTTPGLQAAGAACVSRPATAMVQQQQQSLTTGRSQPVRSTCWWLAPRGTSASEQRGRVCGLWMFVGPGWP